MIEEEGKCRAEAEARGLPEKKRGQETGMERAGGREIKRRETKSGRKKNSVR